MFGWTQWDKHLAKFKGKQVNILEIGVYKGDAMLKFAQVFLDNEPNSQYYGVDTWEGSPEYVGVDFKEIERKTIEKKNSSPSKSRINLIKKESTLALPMLVANNIEFDIIYIDASHVAKDVLYDSVVCMHLLREKGVLIFDDYLWEKLEPALFTPKPAIDSILEIYKDIIDILYIGYQVIIQKVPPKFKAKKSVRTIISGFSDLLQKYWYENRARVLIDLNYQPISEIQFGFQKPTFVEDTTTGVRYHTNETIEKLWRLPSEILTVYSTKNFENIKNEIALRTKRQQVQKSKLVYLEFNIYSIRNLLSAHKIGLQEDNLSTINLYSVSGVADFEKYIERINTHKYNKKVEETVPVDIYSDNKLDTHKIKAFLELCQKIKPVRRVVGMASLINHSHQSYQRNLLVNFLSLQHLLVKNGRYEIIIGITGEFLNDFLRLLTSSFSRVTLSFIPFKLHTVMFSLTCLGFKGMAEDTYVKILRRLPLNSEMTLIKLFKTDVDVFDPDTFFREKEPQMKNIIKEYEENKEIILKNLDKFEIVQTKRTLDDIFAYVF
jgi:predicted O-methyltransferase YrrM